MPEEIVIPEYDDMRDADIDLAYFVNNELTAEWIPVYNAMCKPANPVTLEVLDIYRQFKQEIDAGTVMTKERVDGEYIIRIVTLVDVISAIKLLDRRYLPDVIKGILMHTHCPLDCHEYNPKQVEVEDAN